MTTLLPQASIDSGFVCACGDWARSACIGEPFYKEHDGKRYCVLHFPGKDKPDAAFAEALKRKLTSDFKGVWFPFDPGFSDQVFSQPADFTLAFFSSHAKFHKTTFRSGAYFNGATFHHGATFSQADFEAGVNFSNTTFREATDFSYARFGGEVDFSGTIFKTAVKFYSATFKDRVRFSGSKGRPIFGHTWWLELQFARIERPEHFSFRSLTAYASWFVNVDARKFEFVDVEWTSRSIENEFFILVGQGVSSPLRMLAIACRNLAVNAEENHRYEEASKFRYMAMDARRLETWRGFGFWRLGWWYWLASGYGERVARAAVVLLGILLVSAALFTQVGFARWEPRRASESEATAKRDEIGEPLGISRALTYSAAVMTFQRPEPRPATTAAQTIVLLETILGPVQAALLALAIRRKFMR